MKGFLTRHTLLGPVKPKHGDLALLVCCFVTGLLDAASFNNWEVFVGMQTGNTVILGLSTARLPSNEPYAYATTLVSIISFFIGALVTAQICHLLGPLRRIVVVLNFFTQAMLIVLAAALTTTSLVPKTRIQPSSIPLPAYDPYSSVLADIKILIPLAPLAFQFGMQIATSRILGFGELPTNVLTSGYADLAGDRRILAWDNPKRNRRIGAVICILLGAVAGAWLQRGRPGIVGVLWIGAAVKIGVAIGIGFGLESAEDDI